MFLHFDLLTFSFFVCVASKFLHKIRLASTTTCFLLSSLCCFPPDLISGFHEILIVSGELGYEIQIREAVVHPNCLTILRFKGIFMIASLFRILSTIFLGTDFFIFVMFVCSSFLHFHVCIFLFFHNLFL